jgi:hypothetical protein
LYLTEQQYKDIKVFLEGAHLKAFEIPRFLAVVEQIRSAEKVVDTEAPVSQTAV